MSGVGSSLLDRLQSARKLLSKWHHRIVHLEEEIGKLAYSSIASDMVTRKTLST